MNPALLISQCREGSGALEDDRGCKKKLLLMYPILKWEIGSSGGLGDLNRVSIYAIPSALFGSIII